MKKYLVSKENRVPVLLAIGLLILMFWLYGELGRFRREAISAATNAEACKIFSQKIIELKKKPELISGKMSSTAQIAQSVESAMQEAGITSDKLVRIEPRTAKRIEKTPFLEQQSHLELREVTMEQLIRFLHLLETKSRLEATDLRVHAPHSGVRDSGPEIWNAELVLTNTIYLP
ncbi:MAG: hypothetical protein Q4G68_13675 [Planctomycetia bacterium]|nr:hypothetical protein [Planctomycetia bacterium]